MSKDAIKRIREAEAEAEKIRADAVEAAKEKIRRTEAEGKLLCSKAETDATKVNSEKLAVAEQMISKSLEEKKTAAEKSALAEISKAELNMRDAVKIIVGEVMKQCQY